MADEVDGPSDPVESEAERPWPVVSRSMVNHHGNVVQGGVIHGDPVLALGGVGALWPGLVLLLAGAGLAGLGLLGWVSVLVRSLTGFAEVHHPTLPSGMSVGVVHALAFVVGAIVILAGVALIRTRPRTWGQIVGLILIFAAVVVLAVVALGGAPVSVLLPRFSP